MNILQTLLELCSAEASSGAGTGQQRQLEQRVRRRAVAFAARLIERGSSREEAARRLGLCERTLRQWEHDLGQDRPPPPLGRPPADAGPEQQQAALNWLRDLGPGVGVPALRTHFPDVSRAELTELVHGYRQLWQAQNPRLLHVLHWQRPGTVWAIDFAEPAAPGGRTLPPIDGRHPYLLAVRDLASGYQLLWQPVRAASADVVIAALTPLFMICGSPWVLKMDNGSAFIAEATQRFLQRWQTLSLFSPPCRPQYNGSIEAAIGSLKTRTHRLAVHTGHPDFWTGGVIEAARQQANASARPRRLHGATPEEVWHSRPPLTAPERADFRASVAGFQDQARWDQHLPLAGELCRSDQAAVDRIALRRALVAHDLLWFRRRRIPAPMERPKVTLRG